MGGGGLWDVGCYPLSYTRALLGTEPQGVFGFQVTGPTGVDEFFAGQLHFPDDIYAEFDCSVKIPYHVFMEIVGEEATLIIPKPFSPGVKEKLFLARDGKTEVIAVKGTETYSGEVEDMADAVLLAHKSQAQKIKELVKKLARLAPPLLDGLAEHDPRRLDHAPAGSAVDRGLGELGLRREHVLLHLLHLLHHVVLRGLGFGHGTP